MRMLFETQDLFFAELYIAVDLIVGHDIAGCKKGAIFVERSNGFPQ